VAAYGRIHWKSSPQGEERDVGRRSSCLSGTAGNEGRVELPFSRKCPIHTEASRAHTRRKPLEADGEGNKESYMSRRKITYSFTTGSTFLRQGLTKIAALRE